ncbi:efflux RND transporter periplasmic adaptor subunit [candidate division WOR-3 bacterium]|nr:efflux RND transporter periplasmic adaptor subunit [candidate division WOR-3 bacterium]
MKRRTRSVLIVAGIVVVLGAIVLLNLRPSEKGEPVNTHAVGFGSILSRVSATGELKARAQVNLQAELMGVVNRLHVEEGDWVSRGDLLLELDRKSYQAQLVSARARWVQARQSHARVESLYARQLVSAEQHEASLAAFEMAEAQYEEARDRHEKTSIRAPIAGTVTRVNVEEGETVIIGTMNNPGTVMMVIADLSEMEAVVSVDETDVVTLEPGQRADVEVDALPDTVFAGAVTRIGLMPIQDVLSTTANVVEFETTVALDSTVPALRPGMTVSVDITTASLDSVLVVPIQAVGRREVADEERETVFVVEGGKAVLRSITTGRSSDTELEVKSGLAPGDTVITGPYKVLAKLRDGKPVRSTRQPGASDAEDAPAAPGR